MHTITFSSMVCMKNRISQTVKLNSLERCYSKEKAGAERKLSAAHFPMHSWWFGDFQYRRGILAFSIGWQWPTNSFVSPAIQNQTKKEESNKLKLFWNLIVPFIGCQVFFPMLFTEGNNLAKFEKPWSKIRNHTFSVAVSNFIF